MLKRIHLENFKCYREADIGFAPLTVFSGMNAVGKSTVLQAINLLRQVSARSVEIPCGLVRTEGPLVSFGSVDELVNSNAPRNEETPVVIELTGDASDESARLTLHRLGKDAPEARTALVVHGGSLPSSGVLLGSDYAYLCADRISPMDKFTYNDSDEMRQLNLLGNRGEFVAWYLGLMDRMPLPNSALLCPDGDAARNSLVQQVGFWMSRLGREVQVLPSLYEDIRRAGIRFSFVEDDVPGPWYSPRNVGFGLTHSLPVFVALLSRPQNAVVAIENPESHLHPKAQVFMGEFVARAAASGLQVLLETHSDHVLNGIRLAVKNGIVSPDQVRLNFMVSDAKKGVDCMVPKILPSGAIDVWPVGFFDEYENVASALI